MTKLSERIQRLSESQTLAMAKKSRELQAKGIDVVNLSLGEPDFDTPQFVKDAAKKAIDENFSHYTPVPGYLDLRKAIALKLKRDNNLDYAAENIVVSTGAKQSIANAVLSLIDKGDEVIVPIPYWVSYIELIKLSEGTPVYIKTSVDSNFKFNASQLEKAITPKTRMLIFSSPCNPSGSIYNQQELKAIADVLAKHPDIIIISDEIYENINFVGKHESIAQFDFIKDRVVVVNGVSKGFAMTGWRLGYIAAPKIIADACEKMQGQFTSATSSITQKAAEAAMNADQYVTFSMRDAFKKRRDLVLSLLKEIPGIKANIPDGAFYVFPDITYYFGKSDGETTIKTSNDLCMFLLNKANVAIVSGDAFGDDNCVRISYATSEDKLKEAMKRMKTTLSTLK